VEEKVLEASIVNNETVSPIENRLSERAEIRLSKAEKRLNNKIDKLQKDPNRTFWNSSGNRWIIIGLVFLLASILFYIFPGLGILGALCSLVGIVLIIVGLLIGLDAI
jgi:polyferredoxin